MPESEYLYPDIRLWIFDFDGTLVDLGVDWVEVRTDMRQYLKGKYSKELDFTSLEGGWREARLVIGEQVSKELTVILSSFESQAALLAKPLRGLETARKLSVGRQVAILSSNLSETVNSVLQHMDGTFFHPVLGRNLVDEVKPEPSGLLKLLDLAHVGKDSAIMVGDRDVDEAAANRAGVAFLHIDELNRLANNKG